MASVSESSAACYSCRSRKVKCDRCRPLCGTCMRLQLRCSYERSPESPTFGRKDPSTHTEAGTKRKRARLACQPCRQVKAKCSGNGPCERCLSRSLSCDLTIGDVQQPRDDGITSMPTPRTSASTVSSTTVSIRAWPLNKAIARRYLDIYLDSANRAVPTFLHKPSILADWGKGTLDANLLKSIVAFGLFLSDSRPDTRATAQSWIQEIQDETFKSFGKQSVVHLRILVVLLRFRFQAGNFSDAWSLLALAARSAFTMRLNYEHEGKDPLIQESNRRLVWAIYQLDRLFSGGIEDLIVCPVERVHIRLPCDERSFEMGIPSKAGFLHEIGIEQGASVDAHAFKLRLLAIRDRILRYTKGVRRLGNSPAESRGDMEALQVELNAFERNLPAELKLTSERLVVMGHSREAGAYVGLHALWMLCHCDLYRFCVPGIREAVSKNALARTPPEFIEYCQQACLSTAVRLCELWSDLYRLESSEYFGDEFLAVSVYQVTQILHHLPHLLPDEGDNSAVSLRKKLTEALQLAMPLRRTYASVINCLKDTERLINALGRGSAVQSSPASEINEREHLSSKHTILPNMYRYEEAGDGETSPARAHRRNLVFSNDIEMVPPSHFSTAEPLSDRERGEDRGSGSGFSDMFLIDPFNMQLNGYYDPDLEFSFM
ncbi:hypothetical protein BJY04DRAFT_227447 [Aspergillus karnatakaensis]|uniref:Zn(II)2Cys6 transcription factor n=1 Tax=Aspergillus karnatakaensis TaxID=1810916 RepID=UPI003CCE44B5